VQNEETMRHPRYPSLLEVNARLHLSRLAERIGRPATLDDVPDETLDGWARTGFDLIWFLGVWQTGPAGRRVSASDPNLLAEFRRTLSDFDLSDICGSCFAIQDYRVHDDFGGDAALDRLRRRLHDRGLRLILDFVPNHTAPDHPWVTEHPEFYVEGTEAQLTAAPRDYGLVMTGAGERILAYGRDPHLPGWSDTLQLNYGNPALQDAMRGELRRIARRADGVRCDMAMLVLPEVFEETWGIAAEPFWPDVTARIHEELPDFLFLAEVYWDLEWTLQQQGFDYTYDKRLYDRLEAGRARPVREHLKAGLDFQDRLARFLENHDELRAAAAFAPEAHQAAAIVTYLTPGLRLFHQGQFEGRQVRIPVHLRREPAEPVDQSIAALYETLLSCLRDPVFRDGDWQLLGCRPAWEGNATWDDFIAWTWTEPGGGTRLVTVNYSDHRSRCYVTLSWPNLAEHDWRLSDRFGPAVYERNGHDLAAKGLFLDVPAWACHVFDVRPIRA